MMHKASVVNELARCRIFTMKLVYGGYFILVPQNYESLIMSLLKTLHFTWFSKIPGKRMRVGGLRVIVFSLYFLSCGHHLTGTLLSCVHHQTSHHLSQVYITSLSHLHHCHLTDRGT